MGAQGGGTRWCFSVDTPHKNGYASREIQGNLRPVATHCNGHGKGWSRLPPRTLDESMPKRGVCQRWVWGKVLHNALTCHLHGYRGRVSYAKQHGARAILSVSHRQTNYLMSKKTSKIEQGLSGLGMEGAALILLVSLTCPSMFYGYLPCTCNALG